jgi:hypothetical protein
MHKRNYLFIFVVLYTDMMSVLIIFYINILFDAYAQLFFILF